MPARGDDSHTAAAIDHVRGATAASGSALLLLSGEPAAQLAFVAAMAAADLASSVRSVLCVPAHQRPLLPLRRQPFVHGLLVDNPPTLAEARCWAGAFHPDVLRRVRVVPPAPVPPVTPASRSGAAAPVVLLPGWRPDPWLAQGVQAFDAWASGRRCLCRRCGASSLHAFFPHLARYSPRERCLGCGAAELAEAPRPAAPRLHVTLLEQADATPDPAVVADWLGASRRVAVSTGPSAARCAADLVLLVNDPAYPDARLDAARRSGLPLVTNNVLAADDPRTVAVAAANHRWDFHGQVSAHPGLPQLVSALERAATLGAMPTATSPPEADADDRRAAVWGEAIAQLWALPRRRHRLLGRRAARHGTS